MSPLHHLAEDERLFDSAARIALDHHVGMPRPAALAAMYADIVCSPLTRDQLAMTAVIGLRRVPEERQLAVRYLTAYRSARVRAQMLHDALVEADDERDALRAELRARNEVIR